MSNSDKKWLRKLFNHWKFYINRKRWQKRNLRKSIFYYNFKIKQKSLNAFTFYLRNKKTENIINMKITRELTNLEKILLKNSFKKWFNFYLNIKLIDEDNLTFCQTFYHEKIRKISFNSWIKFCNRQIYEKNLLNLAVNFYKTKIVNYYFNKIHKNTIWRIYRRQSLELADNFYATKLKRKLLINWNNYYRRKIENSMKIVIFNVKIKKHIFHRVILGWRNYIFHKKCLTRRQLAATHHFQRKILKIYFSKFKNYIQYRRIKELHFVYLESGIEEIKNEIRILSIERWRLSVIRATRERQKNDTAAQYYEVIITKRIFEQWTIFARNHKEKSNYKRNLKQLALPIFLEKFIDTWKEKSKILKTKKLKILKITDRRLKFKFLQLWIKYTEEKPERKMPKLPEFYKNLQDSNFIILPKKTQFIVPEFMKNNCNILKDISDDLFNFQNDKLSEVSEKLDLLPPSAFYL